MNTEMTVKRVVRLFWVTTAVAGLTFAACENANDPAPTPPPPPPPPEHEHKWGEWQVTLAATCTCEGERQRICMIDETHIEKEKIAVDENAHDYRFVEGSGKAPTCEEDGYGELVCSYNPEHTIITGTIPTLGHDWSTWTDPDNIVTLSDWWGGFGVGCTWICSRDPAHTVRSSLPLRDYLDGKTVAALEVRVDLGNMADEVSQWTRLLSDIGGKQALIDMDLSACTMDGSVFDPSDGNYGNYNQGRRMIASLVLPDTATAIAYAAFGGGIYEVLETVSARNVEVIGDYAFGSSSYDLTALTGVSFPKAASIGNRAFYDCDALTGVSFPEAVSIGDNAFAGCHALTGVSFPEAVSIGDYAFAGCHALTGVSFPKAASIGMGAFNNCDALTGVSFPKAASIGDNAFNNCDALTDVSFPEAVSIGDNAFAGCHALTGASFPEAASIGVGAFGRYGALTSVSFPEATSIGGSAFNNCGALTSASFPKSTSIGMYAFSECTGLTGITLGTIPGESFHWLYGIGNLRDVYLAPGGGAGTYTHTPPDGDWTKK